MKKNIFLFVITFAAILSSCKNEDITISRNITFKVNPATVVDRLYEIKAGDLTALTSGSKLQVSLLIYDDKGILVNKVSNEYSAYTHMMTTDIYLAPGNYTAVATSHVSSNVEFWSFSGLEQLSTFKITDEGRIGGKSKILGLSIMKFVVGDKTETFNINIENAGAVAAVSFYKWNKYNNVKVYSLMGKQSCDYLSFNNQGSKDYSIKSESKYTFYKAKAEYDSKITSPYIYFFTFPINNASFRFYAETTDDQLIPMGKEFVDNIKQGWSYLFEYDFENDESNWYYWTPEDFSNSTRNVAIEQFKDTENERIIYNNEEHSISIQ